MDFGDPSPEAQAPPQRPALVCIPSSDGGFAALAQLRLIEAYNPADLEDLLRPIYPMAVVRRRELSAESVETWYVYRDGVFTPS
jgi:hypothetical protein